MIIEYYQNKLFGKRIRNTKLLFVHKSLDEICFKLLIIQYKISHCQSFIQVCENQIKKGK